MALSAGAAGKCPSPLATGIAALGSLISVPAVLSMKALLLL